MPTFTEETTPYEVLLRFSEGQLSGAHYQTITQVKRDGLIISSQIDAPQKLALVEGEEGQKLNEVLGDITAATIIDNRLLAEELSAANSRIYELTDLLEKEQAAAAAAVKEQ